jgi:penicillin-binding protein 2
MKKNKLFFLNKGESKHLNFSNRTNRLLEISFFIYVFGVSIFLVILLLRLFQLTIVKGQYYRQLSEQNRTKEIVIEAPRGEIRDRKGFLIAGNIPPEINTNLNQLKKNERITSKRVYQASDITASLIGYRQIADENDLKNDNCPYKLKLGDKTGKKGVEKLFECLLRGRSGKKLIETDAQGKPLKTITVLPPESGETIQLSVDLELQKKAYELIKDKKAAIIAVVPKTGEVLVDVSTPSFNPQDFEDQIDNNIKKYLTDKENPLFNRVTEGIYPPGSLFKLAIATAGLEEKAIDEKTQIEDTGILHAGSLTFGNWYYLQYGKTEGMVDIVKAIRRSNDIFFYKTGEKTGVDQIKKWAEILGYGKKTGIGLDEAEGLIPSTFWKEETLKDRWYLGDTYNLSIGQGYVSVTPLQTVMVTSVFANGGYLCQPQLLKVGTIHELSLQGIKPYCKKLPISQKTISLIREGMKEACSTGGTGWPLFDFKPQTACKTGTAETPNKSGQPHAWITVFAPYDNPEIALTVLIEEGGQGSDVAGPIAKEILKAYFGRNQ